MPRLDCLATAALLVLAAPLVAEETTVYADAAAYAARLDATVLDDYSHPGYQMFQTNEEMSAVLGETSYVSTFWDNTNIIQNERYCAGCNGSFLLGFNTTSIAEESPTGHFSAFGVGFDVVLHFVDTTPYVVSVIFGDLTVEDYLLPATGGYFGIVSTKLIHSLHVGGPGLDVQGDGSVTIDNLLIGTSATVFGDGFESGDTAAWSSTAF